MIFQDSFYDTGISYEFADASAMIARRGDGDLLKGMEDIASMELEAINSDTVDEFQSDWRYEIRAYNVVFENMSKLFEVAQ